MAHVEVRGESWSKYVRVTGTGSVVYKIKNKKMYSTRSEYMTCTVDIIYYFVAAFIHGVCVRNLGPSKYRTENSVLSLLALHA